MSCKPQTPRVPEANHQLQKMEGSHLSPTYRSEQARRGARCEAAWVSANVDRNTAVQCTTNVCYSAWSKLWSRSADEQLQSRIRETAVAPLPFCVLGQVNSAHNQGQAQGWAEEVDILNTSAGEGCKRTFSWHCLQHMAGYANSVMLFVLVSWKMYGFLHLSLLYIQLFSLIIQETWTVICCKFIVFQLTIQRVTDRTLPEALSLSIMSYVV